MTRKTITVDAQWALEGKRLDGEGYRVLACSDGELGEGNFADALSRFQLGDLSDLPQVSVSYARFGTQPGPSYLALAIHWHATGGHQYADGVPPRDSQGRLITYTSYFCLPYKPLADAAVGYQAMYEALRGVTLSITNGPPVEVSAARPTSRTPAADDLAIRVAPLLLTGHPVCVLGAEDTSMAERLEFIDTVMGLLPYGFRSRMTAATWTKASNRSHRFRLFFSGAPSAETPAHLVTWGADPGRIVMPDENANDYLNWLQENIGSLACLAEVTSEMGFGKKHTLQALESAVGTRHRFQIRVPAFRFGGGTDQPLALPAAVPPPRAALPAASPALRDDPGVAALLESVNDLKWGDYGRLRGECAILKQVAESGPSDEQRDRYQQIIAEYGLLRPRPLVEDKHKERLYDAVLRAAFGVPLLYRPYCRLQQCAGVAPGDIPHPALLRAILKAGAEPVVAAILHWHLRGTDEKKLNKWLISGELDPAAFIGTLALPEWKFPEHARILCDITVEYLKKVPRGYEPKRVRDELRRNGFLAQALRDRYPGGDQYQVSVLCQFLKAAYPQPLATPGQDLSAAAIQEILDGSGPPPTPALLSAVLISLDKRESCELAWDTYIRGTTTRLKLDQPTLARLEARLPPSGSSG